MIFASLLPLIAVHYKQKSWIIFSEIVKYFLISFYYRTLHNYLLKRVYFLIPWHPHEAAELWHSQTNSDMFPVIVLSVGESSPM